MSPDFIDGLLFIPDYVLPGWILTIGFGIAPLGRGVWAVAPAELVAARMAGAVDGDALVLGDCPGGRTGTDALGALSSSP